MKLKAHFTNRSSGCSVGPEQLERFAADIGLDVAAPERYSALLVFQVMTYADTFGINPFNIVAEIKWLEGIGPATQTKSATPFKLGGALDGLQHKHFTSDTVSMVAANILAVPEKKKKELAQQEFGQGFTPTAIARFTDRLVRGGYESRAEASKLTGEWIVFVEHEGRNYYLFLATHQGSDAEVLGYIRNVSRLEFPFLATKLPHLFEAAAPNCGNQGKPIQPLDNFAT